ncbi:paraquat-inducible protein A [Mucilaginibacter arboris]|uniref:Paraquat-inducible protein A n=1 Tax=Mucilaginibacter arboris TaxID=2682090 RepID=A0A7K1SVV5_9SPHI|nr:paraquat-inducible protein A [Mucilaginibacter arboris]MVN21424.1 paraquat-inducible protein A [Mucilaginibacter arboris]
MLNKYKILLIIPLLAILGAMAYCGNQVYTLSNQQKQIKEDFATINSITFGLLSVNQWKDKVAVIINKQIQGFNFTPSQQKDLQKEVEQIMNGLITKAIAIINRPQKTLMGKLKKAAVKIFVNEKELRAQVPGFAREIIKQVNKPSSKRRLKRVVNSKVKQLEQTTFDSSITAERMVRVKMFSKYHVKDDDSFDKKTTAMLTDINHQTGIYAYAMLGGALLFLIIWLFLKKQVALHKTLFVLSIFAAILLLVVGVSTTMINVEARIQTLDFSLLGQNMVFKNQILFFQSKGILEVVMVLLKTTHLESIAVGALIFCFSILFPVSKLSSALIYSLGHKKWMRGSFIHYFAFDSGKWSMADVMVVAIMMTYLAFNGILDSQLAELNIKNSYLSTVTTNNTSLQPGFVIFLSFVIYSLIMSEILKRVVLPAEEKGKHDEEQSEI